MTTLHRYRFGEVLYDEAKAELVVNGLIVEIQRRPLQVLSLLLSKRGDIVTRDEFFKIVWQGRPTVENVLPNAITKLRNALGEEGANLIENVARVGYRFNGVFQRSFAGRTFESNLQLKVGDPAPKREDFLLELLLGQSSSHEVWLAHNPRTDERRVYKYALNSEQVLALRREAGLARLLSDRLGEGNHFVRLIDWNFASAPFFLESEYGGEDLATWADADGRLADLPLGDRLGIFLQIADAVAAAHSVTVLHMDIKPGNVLVRRLADAWQVRLVDFGSGRLLEPENLGKLGITSVGMTMAAGVGSDATRGTLFYVAPELLQDQPATVRSDVYALGVMLYQLIVGDLRRPLVPGWERDIPDELLLRDVALATDGDPARRIGTAAELAAGIRTLSLRHEDLQRRRVAEQAAVQVKEALEKARARRPYLLGVIATMAVALLVSGWLAAAANRERARAEQEASRAEAINHFLNDDLLGSADPGAPGSVSDPKIRDVLAAAAAKIDTRFGGDAATKAAVHMTLGRTYRALSDYANAELHFRRAMQLLPGPASITERLGAQYELADVLVQFGRVEQARLMLDQTDGEAAALLAQPSLLALRSTLVRGQLFDVQSDTDKMLLYYERAEQLRQIIVPHDDRWLFKVQLDLIGAYIGKHRLDEAKRLNEGLLRPEFTVERIGIGDWGRSRWIYGEILALQGDFQRAEQVDGEAIAGVRYRLGDQHFYTGIALSELANVYVEEGKFSQALPAATEAAHIVEKSLGGESQDAIMARANVGILEAQSGDFAKALRDLVPARTQLLKLIGAKNPLVQETDYYLAWVLNDSGRSKDALAYASNLDPAALESAGDGSSGWSARLQGLKGRILLRLGRKPEAFALLDQAVRDLQGARAHAWILDPFVQSLAQSRK